MKNAAITILSIVTLAGLSGCEDVICTTESSPSVLLSLVSDGGDVIEGAEVIVEDIMIDGTDGYTSQPCEELEAGLYACGMDLTGELTLSIAADGFEPDVLEVYVDGGECEVMTEEITHTMMGMDCTAEVVPAVQVSVLDEDGVSIVDAQVSYAPLSDDIGAESIDCSAADDVFYCGEDVPGNYEITALADGFQAGHTAISVEMDEVSCHVVTQSVDITLAVE